MPPSLLETEALVALYKASGGLNWDFASGWLGSSSACSSSEPPWHGVSCDSFGNVVGVVLDSNGLEGGPLPSQLGQLTGMSLLSLRSNLLSGSVPSQLGMLSSLADGFGLASNMFVKRIPSEVGKLARLTANLDFSQNGFHGSIPSELGLLSQLSANFNLKHNSLSGQIPSELGFLSLLTDTSAPLNFEYNTICGTVPEEVAAVDAQWFINKGNTIGKECRDKSARYPHTSHPTIMGTFPTTSPSTTSPSLAPPKHRVESTSPAIVAFVIVSFLFSALGVLFLWRWSRKKPASDGFGDVSLHSPLHGEVFREYKCTELESYLGDFDQESMSDIASSYGESVSVAGSATFDIGFGVKLQTDEQNDDALSAAMDRAPITLSSFLDKYGLEEPLASDVAQFVADTFGAQTVGEFRLLEEDDIAQTIVKLGIKKAKSQKLRIAWR